MTGRIELNLYLDIGFPVPAAIDKEKISQSFRNNCDLKSEVQIQACKVVMQKCQSHKYREYNGGAWGETLYRFHSD